MLYKFLNFYEVIHSLKFKDFLADYQAAIKILHEWLLVANW